ncbi:hypothetical protein BOV94_12855 [Solemya velum gill symbiont]|uniref:hypothetical protein n=1 Tax=Solemya velum gill symbiont TaxID=2340 RepID=UPI0009972BCD|nr:hypothetical protein [Solemya velum gill symbiont]OOY48678.1 hypothetical protein BOV94_12855 [Solemya velum gill symbiont]
MPMLLRKHPLITFIAVVIALLLTWGFWPQPIMVEAKPATRAPLTITIEEEGRTRVIDRYVIAAPVDGVTCRVQLDVGDPVEQGSATAQYYANGLAGSRPTQPRPGQGQG